MAIQAKIELDGMGNTVIKMCGDLCFEESLPLRENLIKVINKNISEKIRIDFTDVDFVGSSGITHFVETIKILANKAQDFGLTNVGPEFKKVFKLYDAEQFIMAEFDNDETENLNKVHGNRKYTYQN